MMRVCYDRVNMGGDYCYRNKFGFCKFGERCRFLHIDELCDNNNCDQKNCQLRHPRKCFYFQKYKNCKFGDWCRYDHNVTDIEKDSLKTLLDEIKLLKIDITALKEENKCLSIRLIDIQECFDKTKNNVKYIDCTEKDSKRETIFKCVKCEFESH